MYLNKVTIIGNLTRDPELRSLPSGQKVCSFSLATNRFWRDRTTNERKESTDYHNIVVFGRQAETSAQYLTKGQQALIEGRIQTRSWDDQDGKKNYRTEIVADLVQFGSRPGGAPASQSAQNDPFAEMDTGDSSSQSSPALDTIEYPEDDIDPEDIPF